MDEFIKEAKDLGVTLGQSEYKKLMFFKAELLEWNKKINLTSIPESEIDTKHFLDSLSIVPFIPKNTQKIIDIGTGAGFPGIPVKIAMPTIEMTLVESIGKKTSFLEHIKSTLGLSGLNIENFRAEETAQNENYREKYDIALARAVASLPTLLEYTLPFVKVGGLCIIQKSNAEEIKIAENALKTLGGIIKEIIPINIPNLEERVLIIIEKTSKTPKEFPRISGTPKKNPL